MGYEPAFDLAWDIDKDEYIDANAGQFPEYIDTKVINTAWKAYVEKCWTAAWCGQLKKKIDMTAAEHFDGVLGCYGRLSGMGESINFSEPEISQ